jgi:hypothetical protein
MKNNLAISTFGVKYVGGKAHDEEYRGTYKSMMRRPLVKR